MQHFHIDHGIRLKKLMKALDLNQIEFAKSVGVSQPSISKIVNGENSLSAELLTRMAVEYPTLNLHWLITGSGEMFFDVQTGTQPYVQEESAPYKRTKKDSLEERMERLEDLLNSLLETLQNRPAPF